MAGVTNPPRVIPKFQKQLRVFDLAEPLSDALRYMRSNDFSQIVVIREGRHGLLTTEGITKWIESQVDQNDDTILVEGAKVADAAAFEADGGCDLLGRNATVFDAREMFDRLPAKAHYRLHAIIVTEHGRLTQPPLGLITPWDNFAAVSPTSQRRS